MDRAVLGEGVRQRSRLTMALRPTTLSSGATGATVTPTNSQVICQLSNPTGSREDKNSRDDGGAE